VRRAHLSTAAMILGAVLLGDIAVAGAQENPLFSCAFPDQLGTPIPGTSSDRVTEQLYAVRP
jgi:hypothetical protein